MAGGEAIIMTHERRTALAERLWRAAELQAAEVEARITAGPRPAVESERDAKTLSVLARTLRELTAADAGGPPEADDGQDEATPPDDVETLRAELGEKLQALTAARVREFTRGFRQAAE